MRRPSRAPPTGAVPASGQRGHPTWHGPVLHPGSPAPEVEPAEVLTMPGDKGEVRVRRWNALHFEEARHTILSHSQMDVDGLPHGVGVPRQVLQSCQRLFIVCHRMSWLVGAATGQDIGIALRDFSVHHTAPHKIVTSCFTRQSTVPCQRPWAYGASGCV